MLIQITCFTHCFYLILMIAGAMILSPTIPKDSQPRHPIDYKVHLCCKLRLHLDATVVKNHVVSPCLIIEAKSGHTICPCIYMVVETNNFK